MSLRVLLPLILLAVARAQTAEIAALPAAAASAYAQGVTAEHDDQFDIALDRYQAALKQAPNSPLCLEALMRVQIGMSDDKAALATTAKMIATAPDAHAKAHAEMLQAEIYERQWSAYRSGGGPYPKDPKRAEDALRKSEAVLQRATADDPANEPLRMSYAHTLASLHRDEDARREFAACAAIPGTSPAECARALKLSRDADLARFEPAPAFHATTLDGTTVSLDSLAGKVVLVDFWGTWCKYCVRDADYVQSMLDSFDERSFVLLEVNVGDDPEKWKTYVKNNRLKGVQTQDAQHDLQSLFHVKAFPTYVILDGDGIVREREEGAAGDLRGSIRKLMARPAASAPLADN
jgi:thiol-disulfide isomerase/thioredoxin